MCTFSVIIIVTIVRIVPEIVQKYLQPDLVTEQEPKKKSGHNLYFWGK